MKEYREIHPDNKQLIELIKSTANKMETMFSLVNGREMSLAKTNLENAIMWASKAVVLEDEKQNGKPFNPFTVPESKTCIRVTDESNPQIQSP